MTIYDVLIIGGGIVGAAAAENLARRGRTAALIEQFAPGHTRGSSHGDGRILRFAYDLPIYVEMSALAYPAWDALSERAGQPLTQLTGGWDCAPADHPYLETLEANFRQFDLRYERLTAAESNRRFPQFYLPAGSEAVYQPEGAVAFADRAVAALWRLAAGAGATAVNGEQVVAIEPGETVTVRTASGKRWQGAGLILAAGGWSARLLAGLGLALPLRATLEQVAYFPPAGADGERYRAGQMPVFIDWHTTPPMYGLPQIELPGVKVGWHMTGDAVDPDGERPLHAGRLTAVADYVRRRLPGLAPEPVHALTCLYTNTPDEHFILDRHPDYPNIVLGAGFSGHGFKFGPVLGQILADLVLGETPPIRLDLFQSGRFVA